MKPAYLKVPCEMAQIALRERKVRPVQVYLACLFEYPGKVNIKVDPFSNIENVLEISTPTIYRAFNWLRDRNWIGKDAVNEWLFFRGLDRVHRLEEWRFSRAVITYRKDLKHCKAFFAGSVLASLVITGKRGTQTGRKYRRPLPLRSPVSLSVLANTLDVSKSTAHRYRKRAEKYEYIRNEENLVEITSLEPDDLNLARANKINRIPVELLGYADRKIVPVDRIRYKKNKLYLQEPNLIKPLLQLKSRRGLSNYPLSGK